MKQKNARTLEAIADDINKLERGNIFDIGDLLLEARQCEHGDWYTWLFANFEWSEDTAERYMKVAGLNAKYRKLRDLKIGKTTLYKLADHKHEEDLPAIIDELAKHATKTSLKPRDAERVIKIGIARNRFGDRPDATLVRLVELDDDCDESWYGQAVAALQQHQPKTDESACSIVDEFMEAEHKAHMAAQKAEDVEREARLAALLDAPPDLPPPTTPPEPQKLHADTDWAETKSFVDAVKELIELQAKPVARFVGMFTPDTLREVSDFLVAVATADKKEAA